MWNLQALWLEIAVTDTECDLCILHTFHPLSDTQLNSCGPRSLVFPFLPLWSHLPWLRLIGISLLKALKVYLSLRGLALSWQARLAIVWGPGLFSTGARICRTFASQLQEPGAWGRQGTVSGEWWERVRRKGCSFTHPPGFPTSGLVASAGGFSRFT